MRNSGTHFKLILLNVSFISNINSRGHTASKPACIKPVGPCRWCGVDFLSTIMCLCWCTCSEC